MVDAGLASGAASPFTSQTSGVWCSATDRSEAQWGDSDVTVASIYEADRSSLEGFVRTITRDHEAAQEISQEAFTRLLQEVRAGRSPDNPRAWLRRVASNLAISRGRHSQVVDRKRSSLVSHEIGDSAEVAAVRHEDAQAIVDALGRLQTTDRAALLLAASGLSGAEIGQRLGRSDGAARTLLCRARHKLRLAMEPAVMSA